MSFLAADADRLVQVVDSITGTITRSYDGLDRLIAESTPLGEVSYGYDAARRRTAMTVSGQTALGYSYDNANHLKQITQGSATVALNYDGDGRRTSTTLPNGVAMNYSYDAASELTGITYILGSNTLGMLSYAYDAAGQKSSPPFAKNAKGRAPSFVSLESEIWQSYSDTVHTRPERQFGLKGCATRPRTGKSVKNKCYGRSA